jgi:hypothetical protein
MRSSIVPISNLGIVTSAHIAALDRLRQLQRDEARWTSKRHDVHGSGPVIWFVVVEASR